jgi:hypothetical protein
MSSKDTLRGRLFSVRLQDFTKERNEAAKEHPELKKLPKPKPAAWALNQLVRAQRSKVEGFFKNARRLQNPPKGHKLPPDEWKKAVADIREQTEDLVERAVSMLKAEGLAATQRTKDEIAMTLRAAALDEDFGEELLQGQLLEPRLESFGLVAGPARVAPEKETSESKRSPKIAPKVDKEAEAKRARLERKREALEEKVQQSHVAVMNAERALKKAEEALESAREDEREARAALDGLSDDSI